MADWQPPYRLYVVEFNSGVLKAGISANPKARIRSLGAVGPIRKHFITDSQVAGFAIEYGMQVRLARIGRVHKGREWFTGIRFAQAVQIAKQVARGFVSGDEGLFFHKPTVSSICPEGVHNPVHEA